MVFYFLYCKNIIHKGKIAFHIHDITFYLQYSMNILKWCLADNKTSLYQNDSNALHKKIIKSNKKLKYYDRR